MSKERKWHKGPPPHIGWWNASITRNSEYWSWWNGEYWSLSAHQNECGAEAAEIAKWKRNLQDIMEWSDYWPKNARVLRIDPRIKNKVKGGAA